MPSFVKDTDVEKHRAERAAEWEQAFSRIGQKPPPMPDDLPVDSRPLAERLAEQRDKKEAEFQEAIALKHQWRGLDEEETRFLAEKAEEQRDEEQRRQAEVDGELAKFRQAQGSLPAQAHLPSTSAPSTSSAAAAAPPPKANGPPKGKPKKPLLAGVKKKSDTAAAPAKRKAEEPADTTEAEKKAKTAGSK